MNEKGTKQKIQELKEDGITFERFNDKIIIHNNNVEYAISDNLVEVIINHGIEKTILDEKDIFNLFKKYEVYEPLNIVDYERVFEEYEILKNYESIGSNDAIKCGLNYFINHEQDNDALYQTLKIIDNYDEISKMPLIGFQFKYNYRAKILDVFEINDFGDFTKALYNKSFVLLENEIDKLLLTRTKCHVNVINGVRYNGIDEIPLYRIMEYGEIYNNIYRNPRVKCGYKFNQKPSTYNPVDDMLEFRTNIMKWKDKLVCDFRHRGLKCSI